ncbi:MAG: hypothetical protein A2W93_13755 [Bacteroidetes bacterium GWF2_43_63]|nr:MAG: hypothetical protein A2W94_03950 [Bacteroidetes bacterium GWE2_42_42]OFY55054.1 MAG: hypothetical protein A2W93_13755 [Bacteroidetes bacterium GWF2_43_63]HBG69591.1 hypothetical protein [Bacteroidales bacterium]HCB60670.1 hypothetical protein [Bacteroidales bacterium]HCY24026.1 hypothetical protein [Bacteroidales bacterium]
MKTKALLVFFLSICLITTSRGQISPNIIYPAQGTYSTRDYPFDGSDGYTYNASIYNKTQIGLSARVRALTFFVETACPDSVTITIAYKHLTNAMFGGYDTYANVSAGSTIVFSGKVAFDAVGEKIINLQTPFDYDNSSHLGIYISAAWGGTGPAVAPKFRCKVVDSSTEYVTMSWGQDNSFPTSQLCQLTDYLPAIGLKFIAPDQPVIGAILDSCNSIDLTSIVFVPAEENILIAYNHTGNMSTPACGVIYTTGDTLSDGTEIFYAGPAGNHTHSNLLSGAQYAYKAWAFNTTTHIYSQNPGSTTVNTNYTIPYLTSFDGGVGLPNLWTGDFENLTGHGETDQGVAAELTPAETYLWAQSPKFCGLTAQSVLSFDYRIVNVAGYPSTATPASEIDSVKIEMTNPASSLWTLVYAITPINHVASTDFESLSFPIGFFATGMTQVRFKAYGGTGSYFVDIDNFAITDPSGIADQATEQLNIYPNPATNVLHVIIDEAGPVHIYDITGRSLIELESPGNETLRIDISTFNSGLYLVQSGSREVARFFKE